MYRSRMDALLVGGGKGGEGRWGYNSQEMAVTYVSLSLILSVTHFLALS